jgi:hypothetical protein
VAVFLLMPSFRISSINKPILVGVDIQTYSILESGKALLLPFIISLVIGIAAFILSFSHWLKEKMLILGILIIDGFFGYYIYFYFKDISRYYLGSISTLILSPDFFIGLFLAMFYLVNIFLYVVGYIIFLSETKKEFRYVY